MSREGATKKNGGGGGDRWLPCLGGERACGFVNLAKNIPLDCGFQQ